MSVPQRHLSPNTRATDIGRLSYETRLRVYLMEREAASAAIAEKADERQGELRAEALARHAARINYESGGEFGY